MQLTDSQDLFGWKNQGIVGLDYSDAHDEFEQAFQYGAFAPDRTPDLPAESAQQRDRDFPRGHEQDLRRVSHRYPLPERTSARDGLRTLQPQHRDARRLQRRHRCGRSARASMQASPVVGQHTFSRLNPAHRLHGHADGVADVLRELQRGQPRPDGHRARLRRPGAALRAAERFRERPGPEAGGGAHLRGRTARAIWRIAASTGARTCSARSTATISQFIATSTNSGYFDNVGNTRRQGLDLALGGKLGGLQWHVAYSLRRCHLPIAVCRQRRIQQHGRRQRRHRGAPRRPDAADPAPYRQSWCSTMRSLRTWRSAATSSWSHRSYLHGNENNANQAGGTNGAGDLIMGTGTDSGLRGGEPAGHLAPG